MTNEKTPNTYTYTVGGGGNVSVVGCFKMLNDIYDSRGYINRLEREMKQLFPSLSELKYVRKYIDGLDWFDGSEEPTTPDKYWHKTNQHGSHMVALSSLFGGVPVEVMTSLVTLGFNELGILTGEYVAVDIDNERDTITLTVVDDGLQKRLESLGLSPAGGG
jgi:hypothetical protein